MFKKFLFQAGMMAGSALLAVGVYRYADKDEHYYSVQPGSAYQLTTDHPVPVPENAPDFTKVADLTVHAVVHIKSYYSESSMQQFHDPLYEFFGGPRFKAPDDMPQSSGSGVIISADGYITTNNHVIEDADKVEVVLEDKRSFFATVVGRDPSTDLALLKIDATGLPFLVFVNSDDVRVGQWVMAVGNPMNLTSTVTAGIVSAKGRSLNILQEDYAIESFIQTDAAVNPGNSGGALVDATGGLIGINTAIASQTGYYAGYSFAIPSNIVRKVMKDLKDFGQVKRGVLGVRIQNIDAKFAEENDLNVLKGAYIQEVMPGSAAEEGGIQHGDIITHINTIAVGSASELQEQVGIYRPGDKIAVTVIRDGKSQQLTITLKEKEPLHDLSTMERPGRSYQLDDLGASFRTLTDAEMKKLGLSCGVKVDQVSNGLLKEQGIQPGLVITRINKKQVCSPEDVEDALSGTKGMVVIEGIAKDGSRLFYSFQ